jgi:hypothetical protein
VPGDFSDHVAANMEFALSRACEKLPAGQDTHENRKRIAQRIIECASAGKTTLAELTEAADSFFADAHDC